MEPSIKTIPFRRKTLWRTVLDNYRRQATGGDASVGLREMLRERVLELQGVVEGSSQIPGMGGARAFLLEPGYDEGPKQAYLSESEFALFNPLRDDALHLTLPRDLSGEVVVKGWGEVCPVTGIWGIPPIAVMVYGPGNEDELDVVWRIVLASYKFARGEPTRDGDRRLHPRRLLHHEPRRETEIPALGEVVIHP